MAYVCSLPVAFFVVLPNLRPKGKGQGGQGDAKIQVKAPPPRFTPAPSPEALKEFANQKPVVKQPPMVKEIH